MDIPVADALGRSHLSDFGGMLINENEMICEGAKRKTYG